MALDLFVIGRILTACGKFNLKIRKAMTNRDCIAREEAGFEKVRGKTSFLRGGNLLRTVWK